MVIATFILSFISLCISTYLLVKAKDNQTIAEEKIEEIKQTQIQKVINSYLYGEDE